MAGSVEGRKYISRLTRARPRAASTLGPLVVFANPLNYHTSIWNKGRNAGGFTAMVSIGFWI